MQIFGDLSSLPGISTRIKNNHVHLGKHSRTSSNYSETISQSGTSSLASSVRDLTCAAVPGQYIPILKQVGSVPLISTPEQEQRSVPLKRILSDEASAEHMLQYKEVNHNSLKVPAQRISSPYIRHRGGAYQTTFSADTYSNESLDVSLNIPEYSETAVSECPSNSSNFVEHAMAVDKQEGLDDKLTPDEKEPDAKFNLESNIGTVHGVNINADQRDKAQPLLNSAVEDKKELEVRSSRGRGTTKMSFGKQLSAGQLV